MRKILVFSLLLLFAGTNVAMAGNFGPITSLVAPGKVYFGAGYSFVPGVWNIDKQGQDLNTRQHQFFAQAGIGLGKDWEGYVRGGFATWKVENAYRFTDSNSNGGMLPFGSVGLKGPLYHGDLLVIGPFVQGSYFSLYNDQHAITTTQGTGTEKIYFDNAWEVDAGLTLQISMEGAFLYGGPFYYHTKSNYQSVASVGGTVDTQRGEFREKGNAGGFLGIRWPLDNGVSIDLEGQYKSQLSIGASFAYAF